MSRRNRVWILITSITRVAADYTMERAAGRLSLARQLREAFGIRGKDSVGKGTRQPAIGEPQPIYFSLANRKSPKNWTWMTSFYEKR
jgi:hypothetical protein